MSLIAEVLENCQNDAERLILLNQLKKQVEAAEKPLKEKLVKLRLFHTQLNYVERNDWVPAKKWADIIEYYETCKKQAVEDSKKDPEGGTFKTSIYIKVSAPKAPKEVKVKSGQDYSSFFHNQV